MNVDRYCLCPKVTQLPKVDYRTAVAVLASLSGGGG